MEIMIVVSLIGLLATIAIPAYSKARHNSRRSICLNNLRKIEGAKDTWAFETGQPSGGAVTWNDILPYLKEQPACRAGGVYQLANVGNGCYCTEHDWRSNAVEYGGFAP